jgi:hypothetical protein
LWTLAGLAAGSAMSQKLNHDGLDIKIVAVGNTEIKAVITNKGLTGLRLLKEGTILDRMPVEKFHVHAVGKFGIGIDMSTTHVSR